MESVQILQKHEDGNVSLTLIPEIEKVMVDSNQDTKKGGGKAGVLVKDAMANVKPGEDFVYEVKITAPDGTESIFQNSPTHIDIKEPVLWCLMDMVSRIYTKYA